MVNISKPRLTLLQQEILNLLFVRVGKILNARDIALALDVSQPAVSKALPLLERMGAIKMEKDKLSKRFSIEINRENSKIMQLKRANNLKLIYESGLSDFLEREFAGSTIILFGSYSRGEDVFDSDVDIAIIGRKDKLIRLEKFEEILERKINLNFYASLKEIHKNLKENLFNGIVLCGGIEL